MGRVLRLAAGPYTPAEKLFLGLDVLQLQLTAA